MGLRVLLNPLGAAQSAASGSDSGSDTDYLTALTPFNLLYSNGLNYMNMRQQGETNDRMERVSWDMYQQNRADQNTAVQRRVSDLKAAGLHPNLGVGGAGTSQGTAPSMQPPQIAGNEILPALNFAETVKNNTKQRELTDAQIGQTKAQTTNTNTDTLLKAITAKNEKYGRKGILSDFYEGLLNKDGKNPSFNSITDSIKNLFN